MTDSELAELLARLGCPSQNCEFMARQLTRRAQMDAERLAIAPADALKRLLGLMAQGWASPTKGVAGPPNPSADS